MKKVCAMLTIVPSLFYSTANFASNQDQHSNNPFDTYSTDNNSKFAQNFDPEKAASDEKDSHVAQRELETHTKKHFWQRFSMRDTKEKVQERIHLREIKDKKYRNIRDQFGEKYRFELANGISVCASKMIEKHYAGTASTIQGAGFLRDMQFILQARSGQNDHTQLEALHKHCTAALSEYKKDKKAKKIDREKIFNDEQRRTVDEALIHMFPNNPDVVAMIQMTYSSMLDCKTPTGLTIGGAAIVGGYGGMYRQICHSPLGRRMEMMRLHGGPALGVLGVGDTSAFGNFSQPSDAYQQSRPFRVTLHQHGAAAAGVGVAEDIAVPMGSIAKTVQSKEEAAQNSSKVSSMISPSVGLGIYVGAGLNFEYRKDLPADFGELYNALGLLPNGLL